MIHREFVMHYQPMVNMRTGETIGAEALIRWQHPEKGMLYPADFLPLIENNLLAIELGKWAIDTALTQVAHWRGAGLRIPVSVNVSALLLQKPDFVDWLRRSIAAHVNVQPGDLKLEVLETRALEDLGHISQVISACREFGVGFALDDFGTGYSSLTYLKTLPVTQIKIDQSFVGGRLDDPNNRAILGAVLSLATAFRRQPIAEGVETIEHGILLLNLGCELAQGYSIARPMPAHEIPAWLAAWKSYPAWTSHTVNTDFLSRRRAAADKARGADGEK
jgi:EAL domain-containing protein (putative c-di-GMP-specific phosphodiesterase class I)